MRIPGPGEHRGARVHRLGTHLPIATGERFYSLHQFKELIDSRTVSMVRRISPWRRVYPGEKDRCGGRGLAGERLSAPRVAQ